MAAGDKTQAQGPFAKDRQIRVFISSTFRDMQAERDYLVKFIFPQLRKMCESRGVTWGEVDLRWGVTDEQAAEGKVLPICLEEIKRCRPYFIGLLGDRYGWVPDPVPADLLEKEPWLTEHLHGKTSVTEFEILHGVLRNPEMAGQAFFYFRDPAFVKSVPERDRKDFTAENAKSAEKLADLKQKIRESGLPVRDGYRSPEVVGRAIRRDLTRVINRNWPEGSLPEPLDREAMDHEAFAQSRERLYIGRQEYFDRLDEYVVGRVPPHGVSDGKTGTPGEGTGPTITKSEAPGEGTGPTNAGALVVIGESGSGKSALLANWVARYRQAHPGDFVLQHYIGATPYSADWAAMLRRIMGEFKRRLGIQQDIPDQPDALRSAFPNWLYMANASLAHPMGEGGRRPGEGFDKIIIVLDALNQLEDRDGAPDLVWLPPVLPEKVRLFVSTLPGRPLDEIQKRNWPMLKVELLSPAERTKLIREFLQDYGRNLSARQLDRITSAPASANPLFLRVLLNELRIFGVYEKLDERIGHYLAADSPDALYEKVIARWERDYEGDSDLVGDTLSLLWAARRGLTESELLDALGKANAEGKNQPLPRAKWSPLFLAMSEALVSRSGLLIFAHEFLRTAARDAYLPTEQNQRQAHLRLAGHFARQPVGPRSISELPWQLAEGEAWPSLFALLSELPFVERMWNSHRLDVKDYWTRLEARSRYQMLDAYKQVIAEPLRFLSSLYTLGQVLFERGHTDAALKLGECAAAHYRQRGDLYNLQKCLGNLALVAKARGDVERALSLSDEEEEICRQLGLKRDLGTCVGRKADIALERGDLASAWERLGEWEKLCRDLNDADGIATCWNFRGLVLAARGDLEGALNAHRQQESLRRGMNDLDGLLGALVNQAGLLARTGKAPAALALLVQSEALARAAGNPKDIALCLGQRAIVLIQEREFEAARSLLLETESICRNTGRKRELAQCLLNQAVVIYEAGNADSALAMNLKAQNLFRELADQRGMATALGRHASILNGRGENQDALRLLAKAEKTCRDLKLNVELAQTLVIKSKALKETGLLAAALEALEEVQTISRGLSDHQLLRFSLAEQALLEEARGDLISALSKLREEELICELIGDNAVAACVCKAAAILARLGDKEGESAKLEIASKILRKQGRKDLLERCLGTQAEIFVELGRHREALDVLREREAVCRELRNIKGLRECLSLIALAFRRLDEPSKALTALAELERLSRESADEGDVARCLGLQGVILQECGQLVRALLLHQEEERIWRKLGNQDEIALSLGNQGLIHKERGELENAMRLHEEEEQIYRSRQNHVGLQRSLGNQAVVLMSLRQFGSAQRLLKEKEMICRQIGFRQGLAISLLNQASLLAQNPRDREAALPLAEEGHRLASEDGLPSLFHQSSSLLASLGVPPQEVGPLEKYQFVSKPSPTLSPLPANSVLDLRDAATGALKRELWEAAETYLEKLLQQGEPVETVAPDLITALLSAHETISPATITRIETLLMQLESAGHTAVAKELRTKLAAKLAASRPQKPWWKFF